MMEAACKVFSERGYANTTMGAVAEEARVAVQTLYFTFHTKADLLQAAYEHAVLGPDFTPPHLTEWWRTAEAETDIVVAVDVLVRGTLELFARAAPLVWSVRGDADAGPSYELNEQLRRDGYAAIVAFLAEKHPLRPHLDERTARDLLLAILGPHMYIVLTRELEWPSENVARWMTRSVLHELFGVEVDPDPI